jgi:hypothetical protein
MITSGIVDETGELTLLWREDGCARLGLVTGRCPTSPGEVVASEASTGRYGWNVGSQISLSALVPLEPAGSTSAAEAFPLTVVGIYDLPDPTDSFWFGVDFFPGAVSAPDVNPLAGRRNDPLITSESTLEWSGQADALWEFSATLLVRVESLVGGNTEALRAAPFSAQEWVADNFAGARVSVFTDMGSVAFEAIREQQSLIVSVLVVSLELVGLIWLLLFLAVGDLVRARRSEIGLARLRGLSRSQVWRFGLGEPVTLLVVALPIGVLATIPIVGLLTGWLLDSDLEGSAGWLAWLAAGIGTLGGIIAAALAARSTVTMTVMEHWRSPTPATRKPRSWVVDAVIIALAVVGLVELLSAGLISGSAGDMTALLVPALLATSLALLASRVLPPIGRRVLRSTDRRRGIGVFLGLRHAVRSHDTSSMLIVLAVAFSLATFSLAAWTVTSRNHRDVATVHNGAPTVLVVTPPHNASLIEAVIEADPDGDSAVSVAIYDRATRLLAVDSERFAHVANWRQEFTETPLDLLLTQLRPSAAPQAMLSGDAIRITIDNTRVLAPEIEISAEIEVPTLTHPVRVRFEDPGRHGEHVLESRLPDACQQVCELRGITVLTSHEEDGGTTRAQLVVSQIESRSDAGLQAIDSGFTEAGRWRAEASSFRVRAQTRATPDGLVVFFETGDLVRVVTATHPQSLPAVTFGGAGSVAGRDVRGLDGSALEITALAEAIALPGVTGPAAMVDFELADRAAYGVDDNVVYQVWTTTAKADQVRERLSDQGVVILEERTVSDVEHRFNNEGPGLALALLLILAAAGAVLAMARVGISLFAAGRRRAYQFAVLSAIGASQSSQRASLLIEQAVTVAAGVLTGALAGIAAALIALPRIPQFTTPPVTPPLTFTPDLLVIAGALGISVVSVAVVVVLTTEALLRTAGPEQLREVAPR